MTLLEDFINLPDVGSEVVEIDGGKRLGKLKVKPMNIEKYNEFQNRCRGKMTKNGVSFDTTKFNTLVVANQVVEPDLSDASFLQRVGCSTPVEFINRKLYPGELIDIADAIITLSGFETDINKDIDEAKN